MGRFSSPCIGEKAADCVEACPVDAIHDGGNTYLIDPDVCIDCGACTDPAESVSSEATHSRPFFVQYIFAIVHYCSISFRNRELYSLYLHNK